MSRALVALLVATAVLSAAAFAADPCLSTLVSADGTESFVISSLASQPLTVTDKSSANPLTYNLRVCGTVSCPGASSTGIAGCQTDSNAGKSYVIGMAADAEYSFDVPEDADGFVVSYGGGANCRNGDERMMHVTVLCDKTKTAAPEITFDGETAHCEYSFTVRSAAGCSTPVVPPWDEPAGCSRLEISTSAYYVPARLARPLDNPYHDNSDIDAFDYDLNICAPVSCVGGGLGASIPAAACQRGSDKSAVHAIARLDDTSFELLPQPLTGYTVIMGHGQKCKTHNVNRQTIVNVRCAPSQKTPRVVFDGETASCTYSFTIYANQANGGCPVQSAAPPPPDALSSCPERLYFDANQYYYTPSALTVAQPYHVEADYETDALDGEYDFNICGEVACTGSLQTHVAACQLPATNTAFALGLANHVAVTPDLPLGSGFTVTYTGGQSCHNGVARKTLVHAQCDKAMKGAAPVVAFVGETSKCVYEFSVRSFLACPIAAGPAPVVTHCGDTLRGVANPAALYGVEKLTASQAAAYVMAGVDFDDATYGFEVNVCGAVKCEGMRLAAGTAVVGCQSWTDSATGKAHARALGALSQCTLAATADDSGFTVTCAGGDECSNGDERTMRLAAVCDKAAATPAVSFKGESSHCVYDFELRSAAACAVVPLVAKPKAKTLSGGAIFGIVLLVFGAVAGVGFVAYRLLVVGSMPDVTELAAGCGALMGKCAGGAGGSGGSGYRFEKLAVDDPEL